MLYKTNSFSGESKSSDEGEVFWIEKDQLPDYKLAIDFLKMYQVFVNEKISEFYYDENGKEVSVVLL